MGKKVIEGTWEQVTEQYDLRGRHVRVIVTDEAKPASITADQWVRQLREWAGSHARNADVADDSRESIYDGTVDDSR